MAAPQCSTLVRVYLVGYRFTAPIYPDCPGQSERRLVGSVAGGTAVTLTSRSYSQGCRNAVFPTVKAGNTTLYTTSSEQWRGGSLSLEYECDDDTKHDCINGACVLSEKYNTPGFYRNLSECETACGKGCSGKCLSNKDWQTIESLASKLKQINCN